MLFWQSKKVNPVRLGPVFQPEFNPHISFVLWVGRVLGLGHMCRGRAGFVGGGRYPAQSRPIRSGFPLPLRGRGGRGRLVGRGVHPPPAPWWSGYRVRDGGSTRWGEWRVGRLR